MIDAQSTAVRVCPQSPSTTFNIAQAIEQHLPLVQKAARIAYHRYGRNFEQDDLVGYGNLGLVIAARKYAALKYDLSQAIDFTRFAEQRIWRHIEIGRDRMATIHRTHWRMMKRGQMARPKFLHDTDEYSLTEAIDSALGGQAEDPIDTDRAHEMMAWLRQQNPTWASIVDLHLGQGMTFEQISKQIGRSARAASNLYRRGVNLLRWKFNQVAYRRDDRTARRRKASLRSCALAEQVA